MGNLVVTIGREHGSGGRHVGFLLAKELGVNLYDKALLLETAKQCGYAHKFIEENEEKRPQMFWGTGASGWTYEQPISTQLYVEQSKIIQEIASREPCVIVGRCSDYVLSEYPDVVSVFLHAPLPARIKQISTRLGISPEKAKTLIAKNDKSRSAYYNYFTNQVWGLAKNYDLSLDTDKLGIEGAVNVIKAYIEIYKQTRKN